MSTRLAEKQRRRAERQARERALAQREQRRGRMRAAGLAALAGVLVVGGVTLLVGGGADRNTDASANPFGQHYDGLEARRQRAGVSTMATPTSDVHIHPHLAVWVDGKRISVPANIGIDPRNQPGQMAGLHTHDASGIIHDEGLGAATLGQFFAIWGVAFGPDRLGPYRASGDRVAQLWIDGRPSSAWGTLALADGQDIRVSFGPRRSSPPAA